MTEPIKRSSSYWYRRQNAVRILDPDGWRGSDAVHWCDPITEEEFQARLTRCTVKYPYEAGAHEPLFDRVCGDESDQVSSEEVITDQEDLQKWQREMQDATNALIIRVNNLSADAQGKIRPHGGRYRSWFRMGEVAVTAIKDGVSLLSSISLHLQNMNRHALHIQDEAEEIRYEMRTMTVNLTRIADALESPLWDIEVKSRGGN